VPQTLTYLRKRKQGPILQVKHCFLLLSVNLFHPTFEGLCGHIAPCPTAAVPYDVMSSETDDQLKALNDELEQWRVRGERAQDTLDDLGDDVDDEELAEAQAAVDHCYAKHAAVALTIDQVTYPEKYDD
jgi:hypothetical protein